MGFGRSFRRITRQVTRETTRTFRPENLLRTIAYAAIPFTAGTSLAALGALTAIGAGTVDTVKRQKLEAKKKAKEQAAIELAEFNKANAEAKKKEELPKTLPQTTDPAVTDSGRKVRKRLAAMFGRRQTLATSFLGVPSSSSVKKTLGGRSVFFA